METNEQQQQRLKEVMDLGVQLRTLIMQTVDVRALLHSGMQSDAAIEIVSKLRHRLSPGEVNVVIEMLLTQTEAHIKRHMRELALETEATHRAIRDEVKFPVSDSSSPDPDPDPGSN